jgi:hypothetical protein
VNEKFSVLGNNDDELNDIPRQIWARSQIADGVFSDLYPLKTILKRVDNVVVTHIVLAGTRQYLHPNKCTTNNSLIADLEMVPVECPNPS